MKTFVPNYYEKFSCIGSRCKHNCCIGWEIDIDEDTALFYSETTSFLKNKLQKNIKMANGVKYFALTDSGRCPFLNDENLCEIHINLGAEHLCDICSDHPRFRNFYPNCIELGLGLYCEEVSRIVTEETEKFSLKEYENDRAQNDIEYMEEEKEYFSKFFILRRNILDIISDREWTLYERVENLFTFLNTEAIKKETSEIADVLEGLERLSNDWTKALEILSKEKGPIDSYLKDDRDFDLPLEQLLSYFIFRHLLEGVYDGSINERIGFCVLSIYIIFAVSKTSKISIAEATRLYSSEIEYSDENVYDLLEYLRQLMK
ncbi:MAG: flagellin lysine-N-methylase [Oscillospiraceae bacterium]|nr:flagellin lysine-N-methylase [Oscillospiraceae bacterium]